jgi:hypothetical protein
MSTGAECSFDEREPRKWYYSLQRYPYGETEEYDEHGPFSSFTRAEKHLSKNHANPGGFMVNPHPDSDDKSHECDDDG